MYYDRGDVPVIVSFACAERKIGLKLEPEQIDYHLYLHLFFEGLREVNVPYKFFANKFFIFLNRVNNEEFFLSKV